MSAETVAASAADHGAAADDGVATGDGAAAGDGVAASAAVATGDGAAADDGVAAGDGLAASAGVATGDGAEAVGTAARTAIEVADWRRRVFDVYAEVRRVSATDPADAHRFWRESRDELFASHPQTPLLPEHRAGFSGLPVAEYDPDWRFEVLLESAPEPARFDFETGTDGVVPFELVGRARVPGVGTLDVWRLRSYGGGLFVPVRDALASTGGRASGARTYGGGRYLLDTIKGAHLGTGTEPGSLVLDFNFAYNPSCAYDPAWACPLAPAGNRVAADIPVGELYG